MLLYSTAYSERARKSQGGNKYLLIELTAEIKGKRQEVARFTLYPETKKEPVQLRATIDPKIKFIKS